MGFRSVVILMIVFGLGGCVLNDEEDVRYAFETAKPGSVIKLREGTIAINRSLTLNSPGVTIRGAGMDKTILDFSEQVQGAEGILVNAGDFTIEDLTIQDTIGDALKINQGENVVVRRVRTEWTGGPQTDNGAYGIYPVQVDGVLVEDCVAIGASDAGIYVGQSRNIVVRNNEVEYNVAGIEIENSQDADVYGNKAHNNTAGILVFNMPNLPEIGMRTRVFDNDMLTNNTSNFGREGTAVANVPAGTGLLINANDLVEVFDNRFVGNRTAHVLIASNFDPSQGVEETFDPYPETLYIHDNQYEAGGDAPDLEELEVLRLAMFGEDGSLPPIVWDGIVNLENAPEGVLLAEFALCLGDPADAQLVNLDVGGGYSNISIDMSSHLCSHPPLAEATHQSSSQG